MRVMLLKKQRSKLTLDEFHVFFNCNVVVFALLVSILAKYSRHGWSPFGANVG